MGNVTEDRAATSSARTFDDVIVVSRQRQPRSTDEVAAFERDLGVTMPPGYAEFVATP